MKCSKCKKQCNELTESILKSQKCYNCFWGYGEFESEYRKDIYSGTDIKNTTSENQEIKQEEELNE